MIPSGCIHRGPKRRGVVLVAVLVVVAILMLVGYQFHRWMQAESAAVQASNQLGRGRQLADSGLHYAAFVLSRPDVAGVADGDGNFFVSPAAVHDNPQLFQRRQTGPDGSPQGSFSILAPRDADDPLADSRGLRFGVEDEAGKINVNALKDLSEETAREMLLKLPGMTRETADALLNWTRSRKQNGDGAWSDSLYYNALGYDLKNGPVETAEEMLLIRGMTPRAFLGNDQNRNGVLDAEEDDLNGVLDPGLNRFLTLYSREQNLDSSGRQRIWINDPDLHGLHARLVEAVGEEMANYIIGYRLYRTTQNYALFVHLVAAQNELVNTKVLTEVQVDRAAEVDTHVRLGVLYVKSLALAEEQKPNRIIVGSPLLGDMDLSRSPAQDIGSVLDLIGAEFKLTRPLEKEPITYRCPLQADRTEELRNQLPLLLDRLTATRQLELRPRININTAPREVLRTLPGLSDADVEMILDQRPGADGDGRHSTPAWLVTEAGFPIDTLRSLEPHITTRSQVFRMQIIGQPSRGPASRIEAVVDANAGRPRVLYWRDITELGRPAALPFAADR